MISPSARALLATYADLQRTLDYRYTLHLFWCWG
jgi:hypothetical protein